MQTKDVAGLIKVYGSGSPGGKGAGLIEVSGISLPGVSPLKTAILTTDFYERYVESGGDLLPDSAVIASILEEMGEGPLGIRSSATSEAGGPGAAASAVHAGENASFMLPNNHPDRQVRISQALQAIRHIFADFFRRQGEASPERMAVVINPIPGIFDDTLAGPVYYPYISGVATSFFPYALKNQNPDDGFARIAFGHGYATVLDDFPVISMATIRNPIPIELLRIGKGQQFFYALDMTRNSELKGEELETMRRLHVRFANYHKIRLLGIQNSVVTIEELVQKNHFEFKTGLVEIMARIGERVPSHFQIEFVFNLDFSNKEHREGTFHIVQLTRLPELKFDSIPIPERSRHTYLAINNAQGHGIVRGIKSAVVVSPFVYAKEKKAAVREQDRPDQPGDGRAAGEIHHPCARPAGEQEPRLGDLRRVPGRRPGGGHLRVRRRHRRPPRAIARGRQPDRRRLRQPLSLYDPGRIRRGPEEVPDEDVRHPGDALPDQPDEQQRLLRLCHADEGRPRPVAVDLRRSGSRADAAHLPAPRHRLRRFRQPAQRSGRRT